MKSNSISDRAYLYYIYMYKLLVNYIIWSLFWIEATWFCTCIVLIGEKVNWRENGPKTGRGEAMEEQSMKRKRFGRINMFQSFGDNLSYTNRIEMILVQFEAKRILYHSYEDIKVWFSRFHSQIFKVLKYSCATKFFWAVSIF